jgi:hypothetical protein
MTIRETLQTLRVDPRNGLSSANATLRLQFFGENWTFDHTTSRVVSHVRMWVAELLSVHSLALMVYVVMDMVYASMERHILTSLATIGAFLVLYTVKASAYMTHIWV